MDIIKGSTNIKDRERVRVKLVAIIGVAFIIVSMTRFTFSWNSLAYMPNDESISAEPEELIWELPITIIYDKLPPTTRFMLFNTNEDKNKDPEQSSHQKIISVDSHERLTREDKIYEVYKNGEYIEVSAELQWTIRDFADEFDFNERIIYGLILDESEFNPNALGALGERGLGQIMLFWIRGANMPRLTDDWRSRDLYDPYDNLLTMMEMWLYAQDVYKLDLWDDEDMARLLYWYNSGNDPRRIGSHAVMNRKYTRDIFKYASELIEIEY